MATEEEHTKLVTEFVAITGADEQRARHFLEATAWDYNLSLNTFYEDGDDLEQEEEEVVAQEPPIEAKPPMSSKKFGTLSSVGGGSGRKRQSSGSSNDDEDRESFYVGGSEHSGQAVLGPKDPQRLVRNVMQAAREHGAEAVDGEEEQPRKAKSKFVGAGRRLGDEEEAVEAMGESSSAPVEAKEVPITLQMWQNGFSLDGQALRAYDAEESREFMASIMQGRIPAELLRAHPGREIDLRMEDHRGEEYKAPPSKPFSGQGQRLGAVVPGMVIEPSTPAVQPIVKPPTPKVVAKPLGAVNVEGYKEEEPHTQVQIRLANGQRLIVKVNMSSPVASLRHAIISRHAEYATQPFHLMCTYPTKVIEDEAVTIETAKLANAVVLQKMTAN